MIRGLLLFLIILDIIWMVLDGGFSLGLLVDITGIIVVCGGVPVLLYISFPLGDLAEGIGFAFSSAGEIPEVKYMKLSRVYGPPGNIFSFVVSRAHISA